MTITQKICNNFYTTYKERQFCKQQFHTSSLHHILPSSRLLCWNKPLLNSAKYTFWHFLHSAHFDTDFKNHKLQKATEETLLYCLETVRCHKNQFYLSSICGGNMSIKIRTKLSGVQSVLWDFLLLLSSMWVYYFTNETKADQNEWRMRNRNILKLI